MLQIIQLEDGCYRVTVDYTAPNGFTIHKVWTFSVTNSDAKPLESGEVIILEFK